MLYFVSDAGWAAVKSGVIPASMTAAIVVNFFDCFFMALITYNWFMYALAVEKVGKRYTPFQKFSLAFPLIVSALTALLLYVLRPELLITEDLNTTALSTVMLIAVPIIYIVAILFYTMRIAVSTDDREERRFQIRLGTLPLAIVFGGLLQVVLLEAVPIFCYCCSIVMIIFYIQSIENQISVDPLTGLNNRGQMQRYASQESNLFREGLRTFVAMIDVNDFKHVNDAYGHAEGDRALVIIGDSLRQAAGAAGFPVFISRYGGDEFVIIIHCREEKAPEILADTIRSKIKDNSEAAGVPYTISISFGYDELSPYGEAFADCLKRADEKSYKDKEVQKGLIKSSN
jgi:diguanylate cyclase (GGDEF)-like protein